MVDYVEHERLRDMKHGPNFVRVPKCPVPRE
jgi:hypothetical protein